MQKKLIALAVAGLASSAAFAQSNVQIFGTLRPSYDFVSMKNAAGTKTNSISAMNSNSSTIGFQGSEELGNGLKAIFRLEYNVDFVNDTSGIGGTGTQDMYVGFANSSWGSIKFGALNNVEKTMFASYDPFAFSIGDYNNIFTQGVDSRNNQAAYYESPEWNGFKFAASYALDGVKDSKTTPEKNAAKSSIGANYTWGGLQLTAAYSEGNVVNGTDQKSQRYGAAYTFASTKTKLFGVMGVDKAFKNQGSGTGDWKTYMVGVVQPVTSNIDVMADYIKASDNDKADTGAKNYNLGAKYSFSKRTNVQALYSYMKNDTNAAFNFDSKDAYGGATFAGGKGSAFSVRMQHNF
ncbi:MAG TPA: porin [Rhodocyclaceae bacterium]|jgi:predicted porin|nr:porin [Rhodocyclaceae bacterium]